MGAPFAIHAGLHSPARVRAMPEGDSLHRAARKLQALVGERVAVETPHPRAASVARRRPARRTQARGGRGGRQEPAAELRGRARAAQPPAHERPLAGGRARRRVARQALARAHRRRARGGALERAGARADQARHAPPRAGHPRRAARPRRHGREPAARAPGPRARRRAARPAPRRGDRERLEGRVALARAALAVAAARRRHRRGARGACSARPRG